MENKRMCDACGEPMHRIGNFASVKVEGQPAAKHDGSCPYECINDDCPACGVTVKYSFEDEVSYSERMQQVCQCGHARGTHGYSFSYVPEGSPIPTFKSDGKCSVDDCECSTYHAISENA
jgi:hypothetical protein